LATEKARKISPDLISAGVPAAATHYPALQFPCGPFCDAFCFEGKAMLRSASEDRVGLSSLDQNQRDEEASPKANERR